MPLDAAMLIDLSLRVSAVLALAWLVSLTMRRAAAATRHLVWSCAVAVVVLLPVMQAVVPEWRVVPPSWSPASAGPATPTAVLQPGSLQPPPRTATGAARTDSARAASIAPAELALAIWLAGAALVIGYMLLGFAASWRIGRAAARSPVENEATEIAEALGIRRPVAVFESSLTSTPIACGVWRPRIVLPHDAAHWSDERRHVVVLHELAHIKRRDCLTQAIAQLVCAAYWFNPLAWIAARRLRVERERACDDFVLAAGIRGSDYANHLLGIAQGAPRARLMAAVAGVAMARRSQLEGRLMAILDPATRRSPARHADMWAVIVIAGLSLPIAAVHPKAAAVVAPPVQSASVSSSPATSTETAAVEAGGRQPTSIARRAAAAPQSAAAKQAVQDERLRRTLSITLLEFADEGHIEGVMRMLDAGADVNAEIPGDGTPLIAAADEGHLDVVRLLLDRGANPNIAVPGDGSPLIAAAGEGHIDVVQLLLDRGADVNQVVEGDENALIQASDEGHLDIVKLLVSRGADVNGGVWVDAWRWTSDGFREPAPQSLSQYRTPLSVARREGHIDIVAYLISAGARD